VVGLALVVALRQTSLGSAELAVSLAVVAAVVFAVGVWSAGKAEKAFGRIDPGQVVIDEVMGQIITFIATPRISRVGLIAGFILFRIFDIIKPFPARRCERFPGGWGIMLDDGVAGLYSLVAMMILGRMIK
jgi:phosphatidylglycerophosphatase A